MHVWITFWYVWHVWSPDSLIVHCRIFSTNSFGKERCWQPLIVYCHGKFRDVTATISFSSTYNFNCERLYFKGYLCYKMITSQNVKHRLRIFLFRRKVMFHSQDIQVFVLLTIPWFTKSVASWGVLVHKTGCIFEYIFWTTTH